MSETKHRYALCPPEFFDIKYSINPWMDEANTASSDKVAEWNTLKETFESIGVEVLLIPPQKDWPDMVYVDVGILYGNIFIPSNFKYPERQGERPYYIAWFKEQGYEIVEILEAYTFEGHGDTLWAGKNLYFGHGFRSSLEAQAKITEILKNLDDEIEVIPVELTDPRFYHLDTCFCPLNEKQALYFPDAIADESIARLKESLELIEVPEEEAARFACNCVIVEGHALIPADTDKTCKILEDLGYTTHQIPMNEFIKGGGACKCLSFALN